MLRPLAFFLALLLLPLPALAESAYDRVLKSGTLRCGYILWPMFMDKDPNTGAFSGITFDLTEQLAKNLGWKVEWAQEIPVGQDVEALRTGKFDALCMPSGPYQYTMAAYVNYTRPWAALPIYLYGRVSDPAFSRLEDAISSRKSVSVIEGDISAALAHDVFYNSNILTLPQLSDPSLMLMNVVTGKSDMTIVDDLTMVAFTKSNAGKLHPILARPLSVFPMSFGLAKSDLMLLQTLNQGFDIMESTGQLDRILDKYDPEQCFMFRIRKGWEK